MFPNPNRKYATGPSPGFYKRWPGGKTRSGVQITWPAWERSEEECKAIREDMLAHPAKGERLGIRDVLGELWRMFGLFNSDPYIARISLIQEAGRQIDTQREIGAQNRAEDQAQAPEQARLQGRAMADAFIERLEERGFKR